MHSSRSSIYKSPSIISKKSLTFAMPIILFLLAFPLFFANPTTALTTSPSSTSRRNMSAGARRQAMKRGAAVQELNSTLPKPKARVKSEARQIKSEYNLSTRQANLLLDEKKREIQQKRDEKVSLDKKKAEDFNIFSRKWTPRMKHFRVELLNFFFLLAAQVSVFAPVSDQRLYGKYVLAIVFILIINTSDTLINTRSEIIRSAISLPFHITSSRIHRGRK